ncbi:Protein DedA [Pseudoclavibacter triregionum]|nr:Protein DedA [Pseudoclavibacter triregionum]
MLNDWIDAALGAIASLDPALRTIVAGIGILLETSVLVGLVVPGESVVLLASTAIQGPWEWAAMIVAVVLGAIGGETIGYAIGSWLGPRAHRSGLARRIGLERIARADALLRRRGGPAIFASRFVPVLHSVVPLAAGMAGLGYRRFISWAAPAAACWALLYVTVAAVASTGYRELSHELHWAGAAVVGVVVLAMLGMWLAKRRIAMALEEPTAVEEPVDVEDAGRDDAAPGDPDAASEAEGLGPR